MDQPCRLRGVALPLACHKIRGGTPELAIDARRQCIQRLLIPARSSKKKLCGFRNLKIQVIHR
jgi:hypothetical protein